mmetsp:Transcript_59742/g.142144  ORF Transcript_59742/g.142144 Transcript_59742/m.142144 type:complete len:246 (+) Transcript_59742:90-827(+)
MRRKPGVAGLLHEKQKREHMGNVGEQLEAASLADAKVQMESLRAVLADFTQKHRHRINQDADFRQAFFEMCVAAGVDPLASGKSFWNELLGTGDFYNRLAVQLLTVCMQTRTVNGGLLDTGEALQVLQPSGAAHQGGARLTEEDLIRAIEQLEALGRGVGLRKYGGRTLIYSVPDELSADHAKVLEAAANNGGRVAIEKLTSTGMPADRAEAAMAFFVREGMCWVDDQTGGAPEYWFLSVALGMR